jgi:hypothetical protein
MDQQVLVATDELPLPKVGSLAYIRFCEPRIRIFECEVMSVDPDSKTVSLFGIAGVHYWSRLGPNQEDWKHQFLNSEPVVD